VIGRVVLDASAAIHIVLLSPYATVLSDCLTQASVSMTPDLFFSEVANALWKYVRQGSLNQNAALAYLEEAKELTDSVAPSSFLANEALVAASVQGHPVYDMMYAVLARRHGATVLTMDEKFYKALLKMGIAVIYPPAEKSFE
jgi:predicted nucleic acid-binding protein